MKERANRFDKEMAFCIVGKDLRYTKNRVISITLNYEIEQCKDMVTRILADYVKKDKFRLPEMDFDSFNDTAMNLIKDTVRFFWMYCADMMERFFIDKTDDDIDLESDFYDEINQYDIRKEMISVYKEAQRTIKSFENDTDYELSNLFVNATYESGYSKSLVASILDEVSRSRAEKKLKTHKKSMRLKEIHLAKFII